MSHLMHTEIDYYEFRPQLLYKNLKNKKKETEEKKYLQKYIDCN